MEDPNMSPTCSICLDEEEAVVFTCSKAECEYQLCTSCVRDAFKDFSGGNSSLCPFCRTPSAMDMISAVCGPRAIEAVKEKVRSSIEFEIKAEKVKNAAAKKKLDETHDRAKEIFNTIADEVNLRCPRCKMVFNDYDGCNALVCASPTCRAAFCAICLKDCDIDAHPHVRREHGNYFDKELFYKCRASRTKAIVEDTLRELSNESFELKQLVKNHVVKAKLLSTGDDDKAGQFRSQQFLQNTKKSLKLAIKNDRLGLLSKPDEYRPGHNTLHKYDISPRSGIPDEFRVMMTPRGENVFRLTLEHNITGDRWTNISLEDKANAAKELKDIPHSESVMNLVQNIKCAVVAFEGTRSLYQTASTKPPKRDLREDEVCVCISAIDKDGEVDDNQRIDVRNLGRIIGLNPNIRMTKLERHVRRASDQILLFPALNDLIGNGKPSPCLFEIPTPVPITFQSLNKEQKKVAHPLMLKTAMEVSGPPGTGKTKTITELVNAALECTDFDIFVLSERNGAINAIADKFKDSSLEVNSLSRGNASSLKKIAKIKDPRIWMSVMTYGTGDSMGESTKLFTLEAKLRYHPEIVELNEKTEMLKEMSSALTTRIRDALALEVESFGDFFQIDRSSIRGRLIRENKYGFNSPLAIIAYIKDTVEDIESILPRSQRGKVIEKDTGRVVLEHDDILGGLFEVRTNPEIENQPGSWDSTRATLCLVDILKRLQNILKLEVCNEDSARDLFDQLNKMKTEYKACYNRLEDELPRLARVHMSTIGSSHRLPVPKTSDIADELGRMSFADLSDSEELGADPKETIVVFDEAGCIPSYELLGLSRLGRDIRSLVLVGDKCQLPPYDPSQGKPVKAIRNYNHHRGRRDAHKSERLKSLLDVSALDTDNSKVLLTTQYRVPKDIADMLNTRIYKGNYNTCPNAGVPNKGLIVVDVPEDPQPRKKYVNSYEIEKGLELVDELSLDHRVRDILIITPYKNQQREFQFQFEKRKLSINVLTIDQCQGQEADAVILSLVRKPTQFLNLNRLNVALSRVRRKLYVLVDKRSLRVACRNSKWESALLASDIIQDDDSIGLSSHHSRFDAW